MNKIQEIISELGSVLPASSYDEIAEKLGVSRHMVCQALVHLRASFASDPNHYGFTVPHVKRGMPTQGEENRFYIILAQKGQTVLFEGEREHTRAGLVGTLLEIATKSRNESAAIRSYAEYETRTQKRRLMEFSYDLSDVAVRAERLMRTVNGEFDM